MKFTLVCSLMFLSACASGPVLNITSSTPSRIEVDGITICDTTPCALDSDYVKGDFGSCVQPAKLMLEAFPINKKEGYTQSKRVVGECGKESSIYFDMQSRSGVATSLDSK